MSIILDFPVEAQEDDARRLRLQRAAALYLGVKNELMLFGASNDYASHCARMARAMYLKTTKNLAQNGDAA